MSKDRFCIIANFRKNISENPYSGLLDDESVKAFHKEYSGHWDKDADDCGFPDKFVY